MNAEVTEARAHPAVVASAVVAAVAVTLCSLVAIAWMMGWVGPHVLSAAPSYGQPATGKQGASVAHDAALLPGETLVSAPEPAKPAPAAPAKPPVPEAKKPAAPAKPSYAQSLPSRAAPQPRPREDAPITSYERSHRGICVNCGTVTAITGYATDEWDVRVRFEDGSSETLRYRSRPQLRIGQRVHLEEGRLLPE